jgi:hypothetical protein
MRSITPFIACICVSGLLAACGGSQSEAKEPDESAESAHAEKSEKSESHEAKAEKEKDDDGDDDKGKDDDDKGKKDKKSDKGGGADEKSGMPKVVRTAKDIVTAKDVLFVFSFNQSEPYQKAEKKCAEKSKDDPKKKAECMTKASDQFDLDGITFEQDGDKWVWLTVRRKGNQLVTIHKIPVEFADEKETSVKIKTLGPDKGGKPMAHVPKELTIDVPTETQINITDPKDGKMVYEAKMGMKGDMKR